MHCNLINNLEVFCVKGKPLIRYHCPLVRQIGIRWLYLLRNADFHLPDFEILTLYITEDKNVSSPLVQAHPKIENARQMQYMVDNIPDQADVLGLSRLANEAIYHCLSSLFDNKDSRNYLALEEVRNSVLTNGDNFPIPFRSLHSKPWSVDLLLQPAGEFYCGGVAYIFVSNSETKESKLTKLFDYFTFELAVAICKHLKIKADLLSISGSDLWRRLQFDMIYELKIDLAAFMRSDDESDWLKTDVTQLRERLAESTAKHPLLAGIDLTVFDKCRPASAPPPQSESN